MLLGAEDETGPAFLSDTTNAWETRRKSGMRCKHEMVVVRKALSCIFELRHICSLPLTKAASQFNQSGRLALVNLVLLPCQNISSRDHPIRRLNMLVGIFSCLTRSTVSFPHYEHSIDMRSAEICLGRGWTGDAKNATTATQRVICL